MQSQGRVTASNNKESLLPLCWQGQEVTVMPGIQRRKTQRRGREEGWGEKVSYGANRPGPSREELEG